MVKDINPAEAFRKKEKKKEIAKNKRQKEVVKGVQSLLNDPSKIEAEMAILTKELEGNRANKTLKDKLLELQRMREVALLKKSREGYLKKSVPDTSEEKIGPAPRSTGANSAQQGYTRRPEESVYFHPEFNPTGAPPPGQPPSYRHVTSTMGTIGPPQSSASYPIQAPIGYPFAPMMGMYPPGVVMGGQHGIPPPPPPRGPPSFLPSYVPPPGGLQYGYAPAPSHGISIGGRNGIPPPPPPRHADAQSAMQSATLHVSQGAQRRPPNKQARQQEAVDPLDPAGKMYTERFRKPLNATPREEIAVNVTVENNLSPPQQAVEINERIVAQTDQTKAEEVEGREVQSSEYSASVDENDEEVDESDEESVESNDGRGGNLVAVAGEVASSSSIDTEDVSMGMGSTEFNIEEIMRRRLTVQQEVAAEVGKPDVLSAHPTISVGAVVVPTSDSKAVGGGLLSLLGAYGSDSDEDDVADVTANVPSISAPTASIPDEPAPAVDSHPVPPPQAVAPKLKSITADPHLIAFIPASLRHKRPASTQEMTSERKVTRLSEPTSVPTTTSVLSPPQPTSRFSASSSLDDEYASFMDQISSLGETS